MKFTLITFAASASMVSAISLSSISNPIGDVSPACSTAFDTSLLDCTALPGTCSDKCLSQLTALATSLKTVCGKTNNPQGLLRVAMSGQLVTLLCSSDASTDSGSGGSGDEVVASTVTSTSSSSRSQGSAGPAVQPPKTYTNPAATTTSAGGLMVDTGPAPTTMTSIAVTGKTATSTSASATGTGSSSGGSNGSLFSTQPEGGNTGAGVKTMASVWVGILAMSLSLVLQL